MISWYSYSNIVAVFQQTAQPANTWTWTRACAELVSVERISPRSGRLVVMIVRVVKQPLVKPPLPCLTASVSARSNIIAKVHSELNK